ncbi:hypothetical protein Vretimale_7330 [Volvox reticuliferus]|uniref:GHMP kinase N-terminal domain-containing protein n=1 Tax=Volvox reticuliferus TaxID=1737510 RepID=A0A8J4D2T3_9CHLO|nr:hypothetical protein Vretifemale_19394 [Volvox reticuliferus]GIM02479.1 hypothetical protein Vretimale_7330 [Volvox reticuliferus]
MENNISDGAGISSKAVQRIVHRTFARSGLFGNPSDQYGGQTIAFSLENFYAEVTLTSSESSAIRIQPHPVYDSTEYASLQELVVRTSTEGLYGGVRLLTAAVKRFAVYCEKSNIPLLRVPTESGGGFTLSYDTNVPRQTGLAGSSAIIYSAIKCLMDWYGVDETMLPYSAHPQLVLSVEAGELGIAAGLQDRVVQVYGGAVHMDFNSEYMQAHGGVGRYSRIDTSLLPQPLYIMYSKNPSESGKVHSGVKERWMAGDPQVRSLMSAVAECGDEGLRLLLLPQKIRQLEAEVTDGKSRRDLALVDLMNRNADLRRALFGDGVLGSKNLRMVELARSVGAGANYTGSGGAVVVFCPEGDSQGEVLAAAAKAEGFTLERVQVGPERVPLPPAAVED